MIILGIETSCDETSVALVKDGTDVIAHSLASSLDIQQNYGGVVPEVAARKQVEYMIPVLTDAFASSKLSPQDIDAIAVTIGPGLMGSLLVGVNTAKTLSVVWQKPLIPINHLIGHIYSGWLDPENKSPQFPLLALIASGGHTDLVLMQDHPKITLIGSTRDDAIGEAYDKVARAIGISRYPGGPEIERFAIDGNSDRFDFPRPMISSSDLDFSYSGLKTAVLYQTKELGEMNQTDQKDLAASFQKAAIEVLVEKVSRAVDKYPVKSLLVTGGVSANKALRKNIRAMIESKPENISVHIPPISLATDNATYIAGAAYFQVNQSLNPNQKDDLDEILNLEPNPNLLVTDI